MVSSCSALFSKVAYVDERTGNEWISFAIGSDYKVYGSITPNLNSNCGSEFMDNDDIHSLTLSVHFELPEKSVSTNVK